MSKRIGFIGYGNMAKAITKYLLLKGYNNIYASDPFLGECENVSVCDSNNTLVAISDIIFLSIKPQAFKAAAFGLDFDGKIVVSIMAGISISTIRAFAKGASKVVRVMPNLCAGVGKSVNAYAAAGLNPDDEEYIVHLLSSFGSTYRIKEEEFDTVTGLTGSGPAYLFRYIKNVIECGCDNGFEFEKARDMVLDMTAGCAEYLRGCKDAAQLQTMINNVCSKGGTTIEGIYKLDEGNFDETVKAATKSAIARSKELGKNEER